jgi:hypothetical protein
MTGNNEALAKRVAKAIDATHLIVTEKERTMGRIVLDMVFGRIPKVLPDASIIDGFDEVTLAGPIWMGKVASPLRSYLLRIKKKNRSFNFISISGGALNKNPDLKKDLYKYGGKNLSLLKDMYISDLLDKADVDIKDTGEYRVTENDLDVLEKAIASEF